MLQDFLWYTGHCNVVSLFGNGNIQTSNFSQIMSLMESSNMKMCNLHLFYQIRQFFKPVLAAAFFNDLILKGGYGILDFFEWVTMECKSHNSYHPRIFFFYRDFINWVAYNGPFQICHELFYLFFSF